MSGWMNIQSTYLNRVFRGLSFDMSHDPKHFFQYFGGLPPWRGGPEWSPLKNSFRLWKYMSKPLFMLKISILCQSYSPTLFLEGGVTPPPGDPEGPPLKNSFRLWKYRSKPLFMPKFSFLSQSYPPTLFWGGHPPLGGSRVAPPQKFF